MGRGRGWGWGGVGEERGEEGKSHKGFAGPGFFISSIKGLLAIVFLYPPGILGTGFLRS